MLTISLCLACAFAVDADERPASIFAKQNLVAWCIVPFDASKRSPEARAKMVQQLGIKKVAYDWRDRNVAEFEDEILQYKKHHLEFFAFWDVHDDAFRLFQKHKITPQIWKMMPAPQGSTQAEKIESVATQLLPIVERTKELGCKLGLYNHGGWTGEPANMAAVCSRLRTNHAASHVGIVYNFHHGHEHIAHFEKSLQEMKPYLLCVNINGMNDQAQPKILPLGQGQHERQMLKLVKESGYEGPIGILDHREEIDAEKSLRENLSGLKQIVEEMKDAAAIESFK